MVWLVIWGVESEGTRRIEVFSARDKAIAFVGSNWPSATLTNEGRPHGKFAERYLEWESPGEGIYSGSNSIALYERQLDPQRK